MPQFGVSATLYVNRLPELSRSLLAKADAITGEHVKHAAEVAAELSSSRYKTGAMKKGFKATRLAPAEWVVENTTDYQVYQELGTSRGITPLPQIVPAVAMEKESWLNDIARHILEL